VEEQTKEETEIIAEKPVTQLVRKLVNSNELIHLSIKL
jgi:hypothetical protein